MKIKQVDPNKLTNVMRQYYDIKIENMDKVIFFQLGDFYEMFFDDAIEISRALELTLTSKSAGLDEKIAMCGVPLSAKNEYVKKLISLNYSVVIVDQVESEELGKKLIERQITKIITPGTYFETEDISNNFTGVLSFNKVYTLAYGDINTGELFVIKAKTFRSTLNEIKSLNIKELLIDETIKNKDKEQLEENDIYVKELNNTYQNKGSSYDNYNLLNKAQKSLIDYFAYTQINNIDHLKEYENIKIEETMFLSTNTQIQLELVKGMVDNTTTLYNYLNECQTAMGRRLLKNYILHPLVNKDEILARQNIVSQFLINPIEMASIKEILRQIYDFERLVGKISDKTITPKELELLKKSIYQLPSLLAEFNKLNIKSNLINIDKFDILNDLYAILNSVIIDDAPMITKNGGFIKEGFSDEVDEYRLLKENSNKWLADFEQKEIEKTGIKNLRIKYNKVFGYFIEVTNSNISLVPEEYIRKQTMTNAERFITTELKEEERKILSSAELLLKLELEIFNNLKEQIKQFIPRLQSVAQIISTIDVLLAFALKVPKNNLVKPIFNDKNKIELKDARHPIIEKMVKNYIDNDVFLDENDIQIITGPNMAGKSTYMRMIGLIAIIAQIGAFVPCQKCNIKIFDGLYTRIGASDNIAKGQSTFMVEMVETKEALDNATNDSLIIFDELGRGTSTYDGIALAKSILIYLSQKIKCKTFFSTHYHELLELVDDPQINNVEVVHVKAQEEEGTLTFHHKVLPGGVKKSYGIQVAKLSGIDDIIIEMAHNEFANFDGKTNIQDNENVVNYEQLINKYEETKASTNPKMEELSEYLEQLNVNDLTPLEALNILNELKGKYEDTK